MRTITRSLFLCAVFSIFATGCSSSRNRWAPAASWKDLSPQSLKQLHEAGIDRIEIGLGDVFKLPAEQRAERCREIRRTADAAGVEIWSVHIPFGGTWDISVVDPQQREVALKNVREALALCGELRPRKAVIHASAEPIRDEDRPERFAASRSSLQQLTPEFAAIGVQLALENLPRTCLGNTSDELLALADGIEGLGLCFDTNHCLKEPSEIVARRIGRRVVTLHVSDYDGKDERHWMPGDGIINWPAVAQALREAGYSGPFLYETGKHKDGQAIRPGEMVEFLRKLQD